MRATPLTGGVGSDIWKVESGTRVFVVKRALAQLRVAQTWMAPVERNASEVAWLAEIARLVPGTAPEVLAADADLGVFAMAFLDPKDHPVWKEELRQGRADPAFAGRVGATLGTIQAATATAPGLPERFANDATFTDIRVEPYLYRTAEVHDDLARAIHAIASETLATKHVLVHGDVSPKNILVGPDGPVIIDAECAWFGDPAFDLAFCLNHMLLKCLWTPSAAPGFMACFGALAEAYLSKVDWEPRDAVESRAARLLPVLFLARVDGRSPVEYITDEAAKDHVRRVARPLIADPPTRLAEVRAAWEREILT